MCGKEMKLAIGFRALGYNLGSVIGKFAESLNKFIKGTRIGINKFRHDHDKSYQVQDIAEILVNMVFIGKEKRNLCEYYNVINGLCEYVKINIEIPSMALVKDGSSYKPVVSIHPEVCAVCPFWRKKDGKDYTFLGSQ